jgi:hypothetical protein
MRIGLWIIYGWWVFGRKILHTQNERKHEALSHEPPMTAPNTDRPLFNVQHLTEKGSFHLRTFVECRAGRIMNTIYHSGNFYRRTLVTQVS